MGIRNLFFICDIHLWCVWYAMLPTTRKYSGDLRNFRLKLVNSIWSTGIMCHKDMSVYCSVFAYGIQISFSIQRTKHSDLVPVTPWLDCKGAGANTDMKIGDYRYRDIGLHTQGEVFIIHVNRTGVLFILRKQVVGGGLIWGFLISCPAAERDRASLAVQTVMKWYCKSGIFRKNIRKVT